MLKRSIFFNIKTASDNAVTTIPENKQITPKVATGLSLRSFLIVFIFSKVLVELIYKPKLLQKVRVTITIISEIIPPENRVKLFNTRTEYSFVALIPVTAQALPKETLQ